MACSLSIDFPDDFPASFSPLYYHHWPWSEFRLSKSDILLLLRKSEEERALMTAEELAGKLKIFKYRIVIQKA